MTRTLDATGLHCPLPVLRARKVLQDMAEGDCLKVIATDPASAIDFQHFCNVTAHKLLEWSEQDGVFTYLVRRGPE